VVEAEEISEHRAYNIEITAFEINVSFAEMRRKKKRES